MRAAGRRCAAWAPRPTLTSIESFASPRESVPIGASLSALCHHRRVLGAAWHCADGPKMEAIARFQAAVIEAIGQVHSDTRPRVIAALQRSGAVGVPALGSGVSVGVVIGIPLSYA